MGLFEVESHAFLHFIGFVCFFNYTKNLTDTGKQLFVGGPYDFCNLAVYRRRAVTTEDDKLGRSALLLWTAKIEISPNWDVFYLKRNEITTSRILVF